VPRVHCLSILAHNDKEAAFYFILFSLSLCGASWKLKANASESFIDSWFGSAYHRSFLDS
jgi:hypothetical protein